MQACWPRGLVESPRQRFVATYPAKEVDHGTDNRAGSHVGKWWCNVRQSGLGARTL